MISVKSYIDLLKISHLWIEDQSIDPEFMIPGKPVTDSRQVQSGDIFVCIKGFQADGHHYIQHVREKNVSLIIQEDDFQDDKPAIKVSNSRKAAALLAKLYYNNPSSKFTLVGITGTNGKTTTSLLIWQALTMLGHKTGWIGTLGYIIDEEIVPTNNTTPDIIELNSIFDAMVKADCEYVVMEVSSHALAMDRVYGLKFDLALFTNLTRDHLDFHYTMTDYFESKYKLFEYAMQYNGISIINIDDDYGKIINKRISGLGNYYQKTISETNGDFTIKGYESKLCGCEFLLKNNGSPEYRIRTRLTGHYNVLNVTMALAAVRILFPTIDTSELQIIAERFKPVQGRLEQVENDKNIGVYVDYAHTPDALGNVLTTLKALPHQRIITVFGAGGDRDRGKRSEMFKVAIEHSEAVIITDDNPRSENSCQIIREILDGSSLWQAWWIIRDRKIAIESALNLAQQNDIVLIAGKGHEAYQEIKGVRHYFNDVEIASDYLKRNIEKPVKELVLPIDPLMLELLYDSDFYRSSDDIIVYKNVSTDSRTIGSESLYFALKGELYDGMDFLDKVLSDKSNGAVVSKTRSDSINSIYYHDTPKALGLLAKKYLQMFPALRIALTGSTGKTTTKEYLANIFSQTGNTLKTQANENNIIGLSKTIFKIKPEDKTAIFELGTNHFGEIAILADISNPNVALITNIGPSHLEFFKDEAGVYKEKTDLFRRNLNTIIYPGDDERFNEFRNIGKGIGFNNGCDYQIQDIICKTDAIEFKLNGKQWIVHQIVPFYVSNIAFAIATALESKISETLIIAGLQKPVELKLRMEIRHIGNYQIINDSYNANPVSMKAAIEFWHSYQPEKSHIAILGDMLELGEKSIEYHKNIGDLLDKLDFSELITVGNLSENYHPQKVNQQTNAHKQFRHFPSIDSLLIEPLMPLVDGEVVVLIKASHSMGLEKVLGRFEQNALNIMKDNKLGQ